MKVLRNLRRWRGLRCHPATVVLAAVAVGVIAAGVAGLGSDSLGPELVGAGGAPQPDASAVVDPLACGSGQPGVGGDLDHLGSRSAPPAPGPATPEEALDDFLKQRFPGLTVSQFTVLEAVPDAVQIYGLGTSSADLSGRITVSHLDGAWRVTSFDLCHSLYEEQVEGSR